ncbi:MAG TPA: ArsR family transcriptional regulator [Longimicrobiaceae bacterium]|nr:ArsR family transcriptional regulator [Longimicrobiaceae bacterium]
MERTQWIERLLASTRGQVIGLLRRSSRTVNELAEELGLTDNAVRSHLSALQRDGLVEQEQGPPQGVGKPAFIYHLTPAADTLLPKAYASILGLLLGTLAERTGEGEMEEILREVGRRAAAGRSDESEDTRMRIDAAYGVLGELGGVADLEETEGAVFIRGYSCPLAALVPDHPQVCRLAESLLSELIGVPVTEHCTKGDRPRCCFEIPLAEA